MIAEESEEPAEKEPAADSDDSGAPDKLVEKEKPAVMDDLLAKYEKQYNLAPPKRTTNMMPRISAPICLRLESQ